MTRDGEWLLKEKWNGEKTEGFFADCTRLQSGEPLAYVIGHIPFLDTTISLLTRPLIPRPETEYWVEKVIVDINSKTMPHFKGLTPKMRVLDLCAGSGCIGVAVAKAVPYARVDFVEIDRGHHSTILTNVVQNKIDTDRIHILGGSLFDEVVGTYDFILSNPPYIDLSLNRTDESVINYEPHRALFAEDKGFCLIREIITKASQYLNDGGMLVIEHEPEHVERITLLADECGLTTSQTKKDQFGIERYTILTR